MKQGRDAGFRMPRLPPRRVTNINLYLLCNWIKIGAPTHMDKSSPDEPRLEKLWLLSTQSGVDKAKTQPMIERCGPAEQSPQAGSTQDFNGANEHLP